MPALRMSPILPLVIAALVGALPAPAAAAPQILALLALDEPVALACRDGQCAARFSSYCLQRERPDPAPGTAYRVGGGTLSLVLTDAAGDVRRLPADGIVTVTAGRSFTSVRIELPEAVLRAAGAVTAALEVGARVSLVPASTEPDDDPQSTAEIALTTGPRRALGERIVDWHASGSGAARLTAQLLNALPPRGRISEAERNELWRKVAAPRAAAYPADSVAEAHRVYERCLGKVSEGRYFSLRQCLERGHDGLMLDLNVEYWKAGAEG